MAIQRAEDKTAQMQARAGAIDELLACGALDDPTGTAKDDITRELEQLASTSEVENELSPDEGPAGCRAVGCPPGHRGCRAAAGGTAGSEPDVRAAADRTAAAQPGGPAMIVRILSEGQWRIESGAQAGLNALDDAVEAAVQSGDQAQLGAALQRLHDQVRAVGVVVPDEELADSDLILPDVDASLDEVRALLSESDEGLIPN